MLNARAVSKRFTSFTHRPTQLKERVINRRVDGDSFWALTDVTLDVESGQTVGLIGANGSGKSTLLKVLGGILRPTTGTVEVRGRVASLLELGAGFKSELSGRENVYLNAAMLGLAARQVDRLFDDIVAFAELEQFIDGPVKHYSSGMYVRLGFAVAVHVDPDVLLVDEVLSVGDEAFAAKCLHKIAEFQSQGRTILCVSHSLEMIQAICSRVLVLNHGRLVADGSPVDGVRTLRAIFSTTTAAASAAGLPVSPAQVLDVEVIDGQGRPHLEARPGESLQMRVRLLTDRPTTAIVRIVVTGHFDLPVFVLTTQPPVLLGPGESEVVFLVPELPAVEGTFSLSIGVEDATTGVSLGAARHEHKLHVRSGHGHGLLRVLHTGALAPRG